MTEYIKREPLLQTAKQLQGEDAFGSVLIVREIENAPVEDVVAVTRCKDCKWWRDKECTNVNGARGYVPNPNWFCGSGERRNSNE